MNRYLQSKIRRYSYTAYTAHYRWDTVLTAPSKKVARAHGYREALRVMGIHARIHRDEVHELPFR